MQKEREMGISLNRRSSTGNTFVKVNQSKFSKVTWNKFLENHCPSPAVVLNPATPGHHSVRKPHLATRSSSQQSISHRPSLTSPSFTSTSKGIPVGFFPTCFSCLKPARFIISVQTPIQPQWRSHPYCFLHFMGSALIHTDFSFEVPTRGL